MKSSVRWDEAKDHKSIWEQDERMKASVRWDEAEDHKLIWDTVKEWN